MREAEFKAWLEAGGAKTEQGRATRAHAVRTIEKNLAALGSSHADLEEAWASDRFTQLRQRLTDMREDYAAGGTDFRILMPQSEKPENRLTSWRSWLGQYGQFLSGEPRGERDADRIRRYVLETSIEPAREREADTVDVLVRDVNTALRLNDAWPNICQVLVGRKFLEMADLGMPERIGADQSSATVFRFHLGGPVDTRAVKNARPFVLFDAAGAAFKPVRHGERDGRSVYKIKPAGASNRDDEAIKVETIADVAKAMLIHRLSARVQSVKGGKVNYIGYGKQKLVRYELDPAVAREIGVPPRGSVDHTVDTDFSRSKTPQQDSEMPNPTNLILYGPPGTGKTYTSAAEAVRLCDGIEINDPILYDISRRSDLRQRYDELVEAGQIRLVTFHQSYSYEEFVEGLRPVTENADSEEGAQNIGFRLEPKRGIFREICAVAEMARKNAGHSGGFDLAGRKFFKMSLGRAGVEDQIFDAAIEGGYAVLGWGGEVDWSDQRFSEWSAMLERWRGHDPKATGSDPNVVQMWSFRSGMKEGDLIIVSSGNAHFRAIGEVTGPYTFQPTETRTYNHRRAVRWLLVADEPLPAEMIYGKRFMMQSCYQLKDALVNKEGLSRLLPGNEVNESDSPDQFVLIIDEINRANISKVFGELITLIERDKRLGAGSESLVVRLPYSGEPFGVPANLHIIGTMNTADRSIALLDTALRRRFVFREIEPDPSCLPDDVEGVPLRRVLEVINDRIEYLIDREHRIGHAFFMREGGSNRAAIDATMRDKVIPLLQEYFFEDWSRVAAVLGERPGKGGGFLDCRKLKDPTGHGGEEHESWSVRSAFAPDAYDRLIGKMMAVEAAEAPE